VLTVDDDKLLSFSLCVSIQHFLIISPFVKNINLLVYSPTERPPPVDEVSANVLRIEGCHVVSATDPHGR